MRTSLAGIGPHLDEILLLAFAVEIVLVSGFVSHIMWAFKAIRVAGHFSMTEIVARHGYLIGQTSQARLKTENSIDVDEIRLNNRLANRVCACSLATDA